MRTFYLRPAKICDKEWAMSKKKGLRPIIVREVVERRVGWEHTACAWCGQPFTSLRSDAKTCSDACRYAMSDERKRQRRRGRAA